MFKSVSSLFENGRFEDARSGCLKLLSQEPDNGEALHLLGRIEYACKDYRQAAKAVLRALETNPKNPSFHHTLGKTFRKLELNHAAIECFKTAIARDQKMVEAFLDLGKLYIQNGKIKKEKL